MKELEAAAAAYSDMLAAGAAVTRAQHALDLAQHDYEEARRAAHDALDAAIVGADVE